MFASMKSAWVKYFPVIAVLFFMSCKNTPTDTADDNNPVFRNPALTDITSQIRKNPKEADLYYRRGTILDRMEEDSLALNDYHKAVSLDSTKAEYFSAIGNLLFEHKDIDGSLKWIERAIKLNPTDKASHLKMAKLFIYMKDHTAAFKEINTVLRQDVYNAEGYFLKGIIYKDLKDTLKAISSFETAVQVDPNYRDAVIQLGLVHSSLKNPIALKYLDNAFKMDTADVFPLYAKGVYYQNLKDYEKAKQEYRDAILRDRQYADAYYNTAYILLQQDSTEKAWRQYDLLTKLDPTDAEAYYNRGLCNELMVKKQEAIADYRQALTFDKDYAEAAAALERLQAE